ncbi:putative dynein intermediate chain [Leishmania major strain Friedlin]|uniref:Dynein axonemal intermediate chain 4 n=1 Tax=Leishmania major TaxID=5664 RepID=Q4Q3S3_LEIMA|nr:putative dynein intermediate chain [Leishmania major strain Friedlin]CAG9580914.1 dynein_intermediate_chain_-_putative [Leishmania major strain Friedlin]CAJ06728.1 putative dynein intermediate chain [Leishmania major strain Friedlin]|eukprot:XP_001686025.1 putative dynein intermediate chain [Leishmania major strain Friedlin]
MHKSSSSRTSVQHNKPVKVTSSTSREEVRKRPQDMRAEVEGVIHVLDGGINRTPLPLQQRQSLLGGVPHELQLLSSGGTAGSRPETTQEAGSTVNLMCGELGSSFMHSSFMFTSRRSSMKPDSMTVSTQIQSKGSSEAGDHGSGVGRRTIGGDIRSLDSSLQSLSFACDHRISDRLFSGYDSPSMRRRSIAFAGNAADAPLPRLAQRNTLLEEATYVPPAPLTATEKAAWRKATTTVILTETPTIFLYAHQDEAVSNEHADKVTAVVARNSEYAAVEETYRTDEGTQFHSTGAITMRAPMKSVQTEVHPPARKDSGALQVTPWMLKDAYVAALEAAEDAEEDTQEERQQQAGDAATDAVGGGAGANVEDALHDGDNIDGDGSLDDDNQSSDNGQSTLMSSETVTHTMSSDGGMASSAKVPSGASATTAGVPAGRQWMLAETLLSTLRIMERAVVQNNMEAVQLAYRGIAVETCGQGTGTDAANGAAIPASAVNASTPAAAMRALTAVPGPLPAAISVHPTPLPDVPADGPAATSRAGGDAAATVDGKSAGRVVGTESTQPDAAAKLTPSAAAASIDAPPVRLSEGIRLLWRFGSPQLTHGRGVACMTWNRRESDMLAVGYTARRRLLPQGDAGNRASDSPWDMAYKRAQGQEAHGMVCCWSLKNPLAPELVLYLRGEADVTALAFSFEHPSLLAVGSSTGEIVVYDIQHDVLLPSIAAAIVGATGGQHTGSIWELQWVPKGKEHGEFLTSISADGRVVQWAVGKSIERVPPDLMHLQRQPGMQVEKAFVAGVAEAEAAAAVSAESAVGGKGGKKAPHRKPTQKSGARTATTRSAGDGGAAEETILSRQCGGMCFDICPSDTAVYIVGTEDGSVLQCSKSQTENYDFEYESHAELVYRVRWSPYSAAYFLTCSADWTSRLYKVGTRKAQLRFHSVRQDAVQDVAWSHTNALTFATVTAQGNAEVWTVMDAMHPHANVEYRDHRRLSAVVFAEQETPVLVVGDEEGDVTVFRLDGSLYRRGDVTDDEQEAWLKEAVRKQLT